MVQQYSEWIPPPRYQMLCRSRGRSNNSNTFLDHGSGKKPLTPLWLKINMNNDWQESVDDRTTKVSSEIQPR